jgi:hypothetical protein
LDLNDAYFEVPVETDIEDAADVVQTLFEKLLSADPAFQTQLVPFTAEIVKSLALYGDTGVEANDAMPNERYMCCEVGA